MNFLIFTLIPGVFSFFYMRKMKKTMVEGQVDESKLEGDEFYIVLLLNMLAPLIASTIFYYGWRKQLPQKASTSNKLGFLSFGIWILLYMFVFPTAGV